MIKETIYPQAVEHKLELIVEAAKDLDFGVPLRRDAIREVFGEVLLSNWLDSSELELTMDSVTKLMKRVAATSIVENMIDEGYLDILESNEGDILFMTEKGKQKHEEFEQLLK